MESLEVGWVPVAVSCFPSSTSKVLSLFIWLLLICSEKKVLLVVVYLAVVDLF
jgi:hypothetical protein